MLSFSQKAPDEVWICGVDFTAQLATAATIASCNVTIQAAPGQTDPNIGTMLVGSAYLVGNVVNQQVQNGATGVGYIMAFDVTCSNGEHLEVQVALAVNAIKR